MAFEMIDREQGQVVDERDRLRRDEADEQPADETRPRCHGHAVEILEAHPGFPQGGRDQAIEHVDVNARGNFGHDTAESLVLSELGADDVRRDPALALRRPLDDGGRRLIATCFDTEQGQGSRFQGFRRAWPAAPFYCQGIHAGKVSFFKSHVIIQASERTAIRHRVISLKKNRLRCC